MKKNVLLATIFVFTSLVLISFTNASMNRNHTEVLVKADSSIVDDVEEKEEIANNVNLADALYTKLNLQKLGLAQKTVAFAVNGYQKLLAQGKVKNEYLTIIDMGQSSRKKRLYIIDMENQELVRNTFVSHGKNSGLDMATSFSNTVNSNKTSLGFYTTTHTYFGKHGLSLRLRGQENGFNDNAERRAIVMHGANYVNSGRVNTGYMGRSLGCPALPQRESSEIINTIKNGSVMFIYHPTRKYEQESQYVNG